MAISVAVHHQPVSANTIRQTRTMREAILSNHWAAWLKFGVREEIADLLKRGSAVLQGETHQTGDSLVQTE